MDAAGVHSTRDLFERGHATRDEVVGDEAGDAHHGRASVVELLELAQGEGKGQKGKTKKRERQKRRNEEELQAKGKVTFERRTSQRH